MAALLLRPQGRRGELLAEPHVSFELFSPQRQLWLAAAEHAGPAESLARKLEAAWQPLGKNAGRVVLKLVGIDTISDAEALDGKYLLLRTGDLPELEEDTFRVRDLVGCSLIDAGRLVGTVVDIQFPVAADGRTRLQDAPDLLAVLPAASSAEVADPAPETGTETVLVPFVRAWLLSVDTAAKRIEMQLPPGLFGTLESD